MKAKGEGFIQWKLNEVHRLRHICKENGFKPVQSVHVTEEFRLSKLVLDENFKFEKYICEEEWPEKRDPIKLNMQQTTVFDSKLSSNNLNEVIILPSLRDTLAKMNPLLVGKCDHKWSLLNEACN